MLPRFEGKHHRSSPFLPELKADKLNSVVQLKEGKQEEEKPRHLMIYLWSFFLVLNQKGFSCWPLRKAQMIVVAEFS